VQPFVSIVIPSFNRCASLRRLLIELERQTYPAGRFEVLVIDDGSSDETVSMVRTLDVPYALRLVEQEHGGPSQARNRGAHEARGSVIVFIDDDVMPVPELIAEHMAARQDRTDLVVIGPMSAPHDWPRGAWVRWGELMLQEQYDALAAGKWECSARQFYTANVSVPREGFLAVGGFDVTFKRNEDVELAYRLDNAGLKFVFNPRADVLHYADHSFEKWHRAAYSYGRYDVVMHRDKGLPALILAEKEFHGRHPLIRVLLRACVGREMMFLAASRMLTDLVNTTDRIGFSKPAMLALSGIFNLMYWQGVCQELGSRQVLWQRVEAGAGRSTV
jgi:GT2 family glycosyltransferase